MSEAKMALSTTALCFHCYQIICPIQELAHIFLFQSLTDEVVVEALLLALEIPCKSQLQLSFDLRKETACDSFGHS